MFVQTGGWRIAVRCVGRYRRRGSPWTSHEIIYALQEWARQHDGAPNSLDWNKATPTHPHAQTVFKRYGTWTAALRAARLKPRPSVHRGHRTDHARRSRRICSSVRRGGPPRIADWDHAARDHPHAQTAIKRFGTWTAALAAARLEPHAITRARDH